MNNESGKVGVAGLLFIVALIANFAGIAIGVAWQKQSQLQSQPQSKNVCNKDWRLSVEVPSVDRRKHIMHAYELAEEGHAVKVQSVSTGKDIPYSRITVYEKPSKE